jgi:hypothetical protein
MAAPPNIFWDQAEHLYTSALHWEGFPRLLWESPGLTLSTKTLSSVPIIPLQVVSHQ